MTEKATIMDAKSIKRSLRRMSLEILESYKNLDDVILLGIKSRGIPMAKRMAKFINDIENIKIPVEILDISFYRDDLSIINKDPILNTKTNNPFEVETKKIILVDDVLYTGRTIRAALEAVFSYGRPQSIKLATLIDRGHKEIPIKADFVGEYVPTAYNEIIKVSLQEVDGEDKVMIFVK